MIRQTVILGGGISGLSLAFYLSRLKPHHRIVILEKQPRWGGWIRTERIQGNLFELGPHSLRSTGNDAIYALELCHLLGLNSQILFCNEELAGRRFIYHQNRLEKVPSTLYELVFDRSSTAIALRQGLWRFLIALGTRSWPNAEDLSIATYGHHVFGKPFTDHLLDPLIGGIYAGDIQSLSMRSCLPSLFRNQQGEGGLSWKEWFGRSPTSQKDGHFSQSLIKDSDDRKLLDTLVAVAKHRKIWTLRGGLQLLIDSLVQRLSILPNVTLLNNCSASELRISDTDPSSTISVMTENGMSLQADHVVSTLSPFDLAKLIPTDEQPLKSMLDRFPHACDVGVVSLSYARRDVEQWIGQDNPYRGFGYLVPSSEEDSSLLLGVLFDSFVFPQQDNGEQQEVRITVMLRGSKIRQHYPNFYQVDQQPILKQIAVNYLQRHLGIDKPPRTSTATYHQHCIPQYEVAHHQKLIELANIVGKSRFANKLDFCSTGLGDGPGVPRCISRSRSLAMKL